MVNKVNLIFLMMLVVIINTKTFAGECWETLFDNNKSFSKIQFPDSLHGISYQNQSDSRNPAFIRTTDGGNTWNFSYFDKDSIKIDTIDGKVHYNWIYTSSSLRDISCYSKDLCLGVAFNTRGNLDSGIIYKSTDFGTSWKKIFPNFYSRYLYIKCISEKVAYALGNIIIKSQDGGETWEKLQPPFVEENFSNSNLNAFQDGTIFFIHNIQDNDHNTKEVKIYTSTDFGNTWTIIDADPRLKSLKMVNSQIGYAIIQPINEKAFIGKTNDGGKTWVNVFQTELVINDATPSIRFITTYGDNNVAVLGNYSFCIISNDGGKTWPQIGYGMDYMNKCQDNFLPLDAVFHPDKKLYVLNGAIIRSKFEAITDIEEYEIKSEILYPNPATDFITINPGNNGLKHFAETDEQFDIYNSFGELVMQDVQHLGDVGHLIKIDVSHLPVGLYFVKIGDRIEKFVKM